MSLLPKWAQKPRANRHSTVVAGEHGWVDEKTGEILVSVRDLKTKLKELHGETEDAVSVIQSEPVVQQKPVDPEPQSQELNTTEKATTDETPKPKKRRGRPAKKKVADDSTETDGKDV